MKKILVIIDGLGDLACDKLGGKTPLEAADSPNLDELAKKSKLGFMYSVDEDFAPESDTAILSILGNHIDFSSRAEFEALGAGLKVKRGDLVLRANFGTIDDLKSKKVIDRRAGRTLTTLEAKELAKDLNHKVRLPVKFNFFPTVQHRGVLVFYGGFSDNLSNVDTYVHEKGKMWVKDKFDWSVALDEEENTEFSANLVNSFLTQAFDILDKHPVNLLRRKKGLLPANMIFARDAGTEIPEVKQFRNSMCVTTMPLEKGIAKASGMEVFSVDYPKMKDNDVYENLKEGLKSTIDLAIKTLKKRGEDFNFAYIHFKETDVPGHDNKPIEKKGFIELLDRNFFKFLNEYAEKNKLKVIITADHSTPCKFKTHTSDPVPVLFFNFNDKEADRLCFDEKNCLRGSLGKIYGKNLLKKCGFA